MVESPGVSSTYIRNIQMRKSKKKSSFFGKVPGWGRNPGHSPYSSKEHVEGKNGGKILVPVRFLGNRWPRGPKWKRHQILPGHFQVLKFDLGIKLSGSDFYILATRALPK